MVSVWQPSTAWCNADFSGEQVVQRHMSRLGRELLYHRIEAASGTADRKALDLVLQEYGVLSFALPANVVLHAASALQSDLILTGSSY